MSKADDFFDGIEDTLDNQDDYAEAEYWDPQPDELLKCELVAGTVIMSKYGKMIQLIVKRVSADDEVLKVGCLRSVLRGQVIDAMPKVGSLLAIKYYGKVKAEKSGREYHNYRLRASEADSEYWAPLFKDLATAPVQATPEEAFGPDAAPF